jgi:hypothetical protein
MIRKTALAITVAVFLCIQGTDASSHRSNASNAGFRVQSQLSVEKIKSNGRTNGITQKQQVPPELALRGGVANTVTNAIAGSVALALIEKAVKNGDLSKEQYALMKDRILMDEGKPQLFGSQIKNGKLYDLAEPETVNQRRQEMGLEPIEDYLKGFDITFDAK